MELADGINDYRGLSERLNLGVGSRILNLRRQIEQNTNATTGLIAIETKVIVPKTSNLSETVPFDPGIWKRPMPTLEEFLSSSEFLGGKGAPNNPPLLILRDAWKPHLTLISNPANYYSHVFIEAATGAGKTTVGNFAALYSAVRLLCLRDPQKYYGLGPGTSIVIFIASITRKLVRNVTFNCIRDMMTKIPFFINLKKTILRDRIILPNNIVIETGSRANDALGSAIFFALLDEGNFGQRSTSMDPEHEGQVVEMYTQTFGRIDSRFLQRGGHVAGQIMILSSKRTKSDALHRLIQKEREQQSASSYIVEMSLWESRSFVPGKPNGIYSGRTFRVLVGDRTSESRILKDEEGAPPDRKIMEVPVEHRARFNRDLIGALRDVGNVAVDSTTKLIENHERLLACIENNRPSFFRVDTIVLDFNGAEEIRDVLDVELFGHYIATLPGIPEFSIHIDTGLSKDFLALSMSHATKVDIPTEDMSRQKNEGEEIYFTNDMTLRVTNAPGKDIPFSRIVRFLIFLRDEMGINVRTVSTDGYQSAAILQPLAEHGFDAKVVSVDRTDTAYLRLRRIIYEERLSLYNYRPLITELLDLNHIAGERKVDHPFGGSKDCADSLCGSIWNLTEQIIDKVQQNGPVLKIFSHREIYGAYRRQIRSEDKEDPLGLMT